MSDIERDIDTPSEDEHVDSPADSTQFEIKFFSKLPEEYQISEDKIIVPGSVNRLELSDLVNDMSSVGKRIPYDFLIKGEFLRGSLVEHCNERGILSEKTVDVEYVIAMSEPDTADLTEPEKDWISGVTANGERFYTCSMAGNVSMYELGSGKLTKSVIQSSLPLTGVFCTSGEVLVTSSKDGKVRFADASTLEVFESSMSISPIQCLSVCPFDNTIAITGSTSGELYMWNVPMKPSKSSSTSKKRNNIHEVEPRTELESSSLSGISGIVWVSLSQVIVSSLDGTIQIIDPMSKSSLPTINTNRAISALTMLDSKTVVTGHADGRIIFWHLRSDDVCATLEASNSCRSHSRMIADIKCMPGNGFLVASASVDGTVKLFDSRATSFAVQSITLPQNERALSLTWANSVQLLSGASDGIVRSHRIERSI